MATTVISGRVDERIREKAEVAIRKAGLTPTAVVQNVWRTIAESGEIPPAALPSDKSACEQTALARYDRFLASLPPRKAAFANWSDEDILALKAADYA